jgi:hypothetical protein
MADGSIRGEVGPRRSLCFLHIGKTGGTSLAHALGRLYPDDRRFTDDGNITLGYLDRLGGALSEPCFISGHAGPGVARRLSDTTDMITLLRRPERQAVSNYLHILADPDNPLHEAASRQSFTAFLRENPSHIAYQAISLAVALSTTDAPLDLLNRNRLDPLLDFLDSMAFVGVIERVEECCAWLSASFSIEPPLRLSFLNSALCRGVPAATVEGLLQEYRALMTDREFGYLFALEALLYAKAESLLTKSVAGLGATAQAPGIPRLAAVVGPERFASAVGSLEEGRYVCPLADRSDHGATPHLVYGPFDRLAPGGHAIEFHAFAEAARPADRGRIEIEVLANGAHCLAKRWLRLKDLGAPRRRTLIFHNRDEADVLEFRVRTRGFEEGRLAFCGVTVRPISSHRTWPARLGAALRSVRRRAREASGLRSSPQPPTARPFVPAGGSPPDVMRQLTDLMHQEGEVHGDQGDHPKEARRGADVMRELGQPP